MDDLQTKDLNSPHGNGKRISFVLPGIPRRPVGGTKIVFEYANRLVRQFGCEVSICYNCDLTAGRVAALPVPFSVKRAVYCLMKRFHPKWFSLDKKIKTICLFEISSVTVPDADWIFATASNTAIEVFKLPDNKGRKGYLIQDYETWSMPGSAIDETFRLGMKNIAISNWLKELVEKASGCDCVCIPNPVDTEVFFPLDNVERKANTIAVLYHQGEHKGFQYAWKSIVRVKSMCSDLRVEMFGVFKRPDWLPSWVNYTECATDKELLSIYNKSAVYVCASVSEGFALTCLEAMACGCALVVSDFLGSREYALHGVNALVSSPKDVESMAENILLVLKNKELRDALGDAGVATARRHAWDDAVSRLWSVVDDDG